MRREHLKEYLPDYYIQDGNAAAILDAQEIELRKTEEGYSRVTADTSPSTAEDIDRWEDEYDILPAAGSTIDQRRAEVWARIRGGGTFTKETIRDLATIYTGQTPEVIEIPDVFLVIVTLSGTEDTVEGFDSFVTAVMGLLPAHADMTISLKWHTWGELKERDTHPWDELDSETWGDRIGETWGDVSPVRSTWGDLTNTTWDEIRWRWWLIQSRWDDLESETWTDMETETWDEAEEG